MKSTQILREALETARDWALPLAEDLSDQPLARTAPDAGNHAMWVMGHAACSEGGLLALITGKPDPVRRWDPLFQQGSEPSDDPGLYPAYAEVLREFRRTRAATIAFLDRLSEKDLDAAPGHVPDELAPFSFFSTVGRVLLFTAMHQMSHFGQLADIRRRLGRPPLLGTQTETENEVSTA